MSFRVRPTLPNMVGFSQNNLRHSRRDYSRIREFALSASQIPVSHPDEVKRRRTILIIRRAGQSFGFTLQTYGVHHKREGEIELITYVDHVDSDGPAAKAGMRAGDVILSINGNDMQLVDHKSLVQYIQNCGTSMRMELLFEDCVRKVELQIKHIEYKRLLREKQEELRRIEAEEKEIMRWLRSRHSSTPSGYISDEEEIEESRCHSTASSTEILVRRDVMMNHSKSEQRLLDGTEPLYTRRRHASSGLICAEADVPFDVNNTATLPRSAMSARNNAGYSLPCSRQLTPKTSFEALAEPTDAEGIVPANAVKKKDEITRL